jgi:hypothetical protein
MRSLTFWFAMLVLIGPIHMVEQLLFGLDVMAEFKTMVAAYYSWFANPDIGTWLLVVVSLVLIQLLLLAMLAGGRWRLFAAGFFGVQAVGEGHHIVQALLQGGYFPGLVSSFAYIAVGVMVLIAVRREWRHAGDEIATA